MDEQDVNAHTFIVRVWCESGERQEWRGQITHVACGTVYYFAGLDAMLDLIRHALAESARGGA